MIIVRDISELPLNPGDRVVACVSHQGYIVIVTERGALFKAFPEDWRKP